MAWKKMKENPTGRRQNKIHFGFITLDCPLRTIVSALLRKAGRPSATAWPNSQPASGARQRLSLCRTLSPCLRVVKPEATVQRYQSLTLPQVHTSVTSSRAWRKVRHLHQTCMACLSLPNSMVRLGCQARGATGLLLLPRDSSQSGNERKSRPRRTRRQQNWATQALWLLVLVLPCLLSLELLQDCSTLAFSCQKTVAGVGAAPMNDEAGRL